jgi:16S rRNA (cytidine1402-2'-O)-methyltransferase
MKPDLLQQLVPGLYLIATPIGNMGDISQRAIHALAAVDVLFAEDTRHTAKLLAALSIQRTMVACHEHNEEQVAARITAAIQNGQSCGLVSDAGTPGISDPGFRVVRACRRLSLPVTSIPGANAAICALSASGLPTDKFRFIGFLPPKSSARLRLFKELLESDETLIFFESTHRIIKFLNDALAVFGPTRSCCVARELTKLHENIVSGPLADVAAEVSRRSAKGEFVVLIAKKEYQL